jgi:hypothetical protein
MPDDHTGSATAERVSQLVYELLDAHCDTLQLGAELSDAQDWHAHLEYLRGLQRVGREALARLDDPS